MALYAPEPTQDIHRENGYASSGGNTSERLFRTRFTVREAVAADHDCYQTCNFRNRSGEKALDSVKAGIERRTLCHRGHGHEKKHGNNNGGWMDRFRPKKRPDLTD